MAFLERYEDKWHSVLPILENTSHWIYLRVFDSPGKDAYSFHHQLLQEYFAACRLCELWEERVGFRKALKKLPFSTVIWDLLDEMLEDHEAVFDYCVDEIDAALHQAERGKKSVIDQGHFFTWILALRDRKAEREGLKESLQEIFDDEVRRTQAEAKTDEKYAYILGGPFLMGSYEYENEGPVRVVYLEEYSISRYAETFGEYEEFRKGLEGQRDIPEGFYGKSRPVINVTWDEAVRYCREVRGEGYGLPTEAQWEKAARGCYGRRYPWGNREPDKTLANFDEGGPGRTEDVDKYPPFLYGIHQMAGNVWEWTVSPYTKDYSGAHVSVKNAEDKEAGLRVLRGGSFYNNAWDLRCANRFRNDPDFRLGDFGFRVVFAPEKPSVL